MRQVRLEIAVDHPEALISACSGGAQRIELCSSLADGGLTPGAGLLAWARATTLVPIHAMVRPRAGNFVYSPHELAVMEHEISAMKAGGADGVVLGVLTRDGEIDLTTMRTLVAHARPMRVTMHRAFDLVRDQARALEDVIACGADILLTSGGAASLNQGMSQATALAKQAAGRIEMMGGAGVRVANAHELWASGSLHTLHASLRAPWPAAALQAPLAADNSRAAMGARDAEALYTVHEDEVRALLAIVTAHSL